MLSMQKILVPTDLSDRSARALEEAQRIAIAFTARIDLLYVWSAPALIAPESVITGVGATEQPLLHWLGNGAHEQLENFAARARSTGVAIANCFCESGNPASVIVERAELGAYDLLVLGTHGRGALSHVLVGSVAEKVVRRAPCPVLTVPSES